METKLTDTFNYFDMQSISKLKANSETDTNAEKDEKLKVVAQQLESVFLELVLKSMHEANQSMKSELFDRDDEDFYQDMLNQQMSLTLSKAGGIGLADVIVQQLKQKSTDKLPIDQARLSKTIQDNHHTLNNTTEWVQLPIEVQNIFNERKQEVVQQEQRLESGREFIEMLMPIAEKAAKIIGIDPKLLLAQSALETGWGKHIIQHSNTESSHNLFGIKSFKPEENKVIAKTLEYEQNQPHVENAAFKVYSSFMESFNDYIALVKSKRYEKALMNVDDPKSFLTELHQAGYATDPNYVDKVLSIYNKFSSI